MDLGLDADQKARISENIEPKIDRRDTTLVGQQSETSLRHFAVSCEYVVLDSHLSFEWKGIAGRKTDSGQV